MLKRSFDIVFALLLILILSPLILVTALLIKITSQGPVIYWSSRVGKDNKMFSMPKFRTMKMDSPVVATHLLGEPDAYLTGIGGFLRKTSLDELPQLWSILRGDMSAVGPRPALFNQEDLIELRSRSGVDCLKPGLTGWAQINGRDDLPIPEKVRLDSEYLKKSSLPLDMKIIFITIIRVLGRRGIRH